MSGQVFKYLLALDWSIAQAICADSRTTVNQHPFKLYRLCHADSLLEAKCCSMLCRRSPECSVGQKFTCITFETFNLGLPLKTGGLSADTRAGDALSRNIWRVTAVSIDRDRDEHASSACSVSAHIPRLVSKMYVGSQMTLWSQSWCLRRQVNQWVHAVRSFRGAM